MHRLEQLKRLPIPEPQPEPEPFYEVTESELMKIAYTSLLTGEHLDLDAMTVVELPLARRTHTPQLQPPEATPVPEPPPDPLLSALERLELHSFTGQSWRDRLPAALLHLHAQPLTPPQRTLLRQAAKTRPLPELNIRKLPRIRALEQVLAFIAHHRARGIRFVRVITGKGLSSRGDPVLKPAVIAYCEGPGAASVVSWAPERDAQGAFGSLIIRLRSPRQTG